MEKENRKSNRLISEKSPYLLQHAYDPVDWFPWGKEAFEKAKGEDKPIFLSIGYATCHSCHKMKEESFNDPELAGLLNQVFVNIKVDREERPDIDNMYMDLAGVLLAGHVGWPLHLILTPSLKPFFALTYLPSRSEQGMMGLAEFTEQVQKLWNSQEKSALVDQSEKIVETLGQLELPSGEDIPDLTTLKMILQQLFEAFDAVQGGIKGPQKFPMSYLCDLLMAFSRLHEDSRSLFLAELTLDKMAMGGIHDHVGGGFSRYAIDSEWKVPHFEKMLSDNALTASSYLEAYRYTKKEKYQSIARSTIEYVLRELRGKEGGFASAQDADYEGKEGSYYTWDFNELETLLDPEDFALFAALYGIREEGNFEGSNILYQEQSEEDVGDLIREDKQTIIQKLEGIKKRLFETRQKKKAPFVDDKIILSSNGLFLDCLAKAGFYLGDDRYLKIAEECAHFLKKTFHTNDILYRRYRDQEVAVNATLDDYACFIKGLISLFEATQKAQYLKWAMQLCLLCEEVLKKEDGSYYFCAPDDSIVLRKVEWMDSSEPSGNAIQGENLLRLYQITGNVLYQESAREILEAAAPLLLSYPMGVGYHLKGLQRYLDEKAPTIVLAKGENSHLFKLVQQALREHYIPHATWIVKEDKDNELLECIPSLVDKVAIDGQDSLYVCYRGECSKPLLDNEAIKQVLFSL